MARPHSLKTMPPTFTRLPKAAIILEAIGFLFVLLIVNLDELVDLPHYLLGAPPSPFRPQEAILESSLVFLLGVVIIFLTIRFVVQIEKLVVLCAWCRRVRVDGKWLSIEEFLQMHQAKTSHGMCVDCAERMDAEDERDQKNIA